MTATTQSDNIVSPPFKRRNDNVVIILYMKKCHNLFFAVIKNKQSLQYNDLRLNKKGMILWKLKLIKI